MCTSLFHALLTVRLSWRHDCRDAPSESESPPRCSTRTAVQLLRPNTASAGFYGIWTCRESVTIDLCTAKHALSDTLIGELSRMACASKVLFEAEDADIAYECAARLIKALDPDSEVEVPDRWKSA